MANKIVGGNKHAGAMTLNFDGGVLRTYNAGTSNWISKGSGTENAYVERAAPPSTPAATPWALASSCNTAEAVPSTAA